MTTIAETLREVARSLRARAAALVVLSEDLGGLAKRPLLADAATLDKLADEVEARDQGEVGG